MNSKPRNTLLAVGINKFYRIWWWITRPETEGVKVLIFRDNKILMVRLTYYPNTWTFPGGGIHKNESPESAAIRECREEVGMKLTGLSSVGSMSFEHEYKMDLVYIFEADADSEAIKTDPREIAEAAWFDLNQLPPMGKNATAILEFHK